MCDIIHCLLNSHTRTISSELVGDFELLLCVEEGERSSSLKNKAIKCVDITQCRVHILWCYNYTLYTMFHTYVLGALHEIKHFLQQTP